MSMVEITVVCKNCGHKQGHVRNTENPGRITCDRCGAVIVRKKPEPRPKEQEIINKYNTWCRKCKRFLRVGKNVYWTPGKRGVLCPFCSKQGSKTRTLYYKKYLTRSLT